MVSGRVVMVLEGGHVEGGGDVGWWWCLRM